MVGINVAMQFEHVQRGGNTTTTVLFRLCGLFSVFAALSAAALALAAAALALELRHCGFTDRCLGNLYMYSYCSMQQLFVV
jgi:hypothetical protein